jgi:hypothetical protein
LTLLAEKSSGNRLAGFQIDTLPEKQPFFIASRAAPR